jgi:two-component system, cell cycle sensor histidine kinase and response regulator CckA
MKFVRHIVAQETAIKPGRRLRWIVLLLIALPLVITLPLELITFFATGEPLLEARDVALVGIYLALSIGFACFTYWTARQLDRDEQERVNVQAQLESVLATAPVGLAFHDTSGRIIAINEELAAINGIAVEEHIGRAVDEILPPALARKIMPLHAQVLETEEPALDVELEGMSPVEGGGPRRLLESFYPVHDQSGVLLGVGAVVVDETERMRLQQQLEQADRIEAIGRLAGGIAHDFNNLLLAIRGYTELALASVDGDDETRRSLQSIEQVTGRATTLTRQLLAFGRRQILQPRLVDLNAEMGELQALLGQVLGERIELAISLEPELGPVRVDPTQIQQVVVNLALNGRDAMPEGGVLTIATDGVELGPDEASSLGLEPGCYVTLSVSDLGIGMDAETRSRVFEPFFTTKQAPAGTGLGLATSYGVVSQSGGTIDVVSEPGEGSTFRIYLPRVQQPLHAADPDQPSAGLARGKGTILVVEDEPEVRAVVSQVLERAGYHVLMAADPTEAITVCRRAGAEIDLLVTDVVMPVMDGHELFERIRTYTPGVKVLFMSGYASDVAAELESFGPAGSFLQKPFSSGELTHHVRAILNVRA